MSESLSAEVERARQEIERLSIALRAEKVKAKISSEYADCGLWEYDISTDTFRWIKKPVKDILGSTTPIVRFRDVMVKSGVVCAEDSQLFKRFCDALETGKKDISCKLRMVGGNNEIVLVRFEGETVFNDKDEPVKVMGRMLDITPAKGLSGSEEESSGRDILTNTYSLDSFRERVAEKRMHNRYTNSALVCVGIDKFNAIVSACGNEYADYIQKTVANIILGIGVVERDCLIARSKDAEFLVYCEFTESKTLNDFMRRIVNAVYDYDYEGERVTASVGVSFIRHSKKFENIVAEARTAQAEAMASGGGCFMHFSSTMAMRMYGFPVDRNTELDIMSLSGGAAKVYNLIIRAFCTPSERYAIIKEAFRAAGECIGASSIFFFTVFGKGYERMLSFSCDNRTEDICPGLEMNCSQEELLALFKQSNSLRVTDGDDLPEGFKLANGAAYAECRAIRIDERISIMFAFVFDKEFELGDPNNQIINMLEISLLKMANSHKSDTSERISQHLRTTVIGNHCIEGFTIVPGEFIVEDIGENCKEHYGLAPGDLCYKVLRGRNTPCEHCPAHKLEQNGRLFASEAYYYEKEQRWLDVTASVDENIFGEKRYVISTVDITDCMGKIRMKDQLTGLDTFNVFTSEAMQLSVSESDNNGLFAAVFNVAEFNRINEEKGFEAGNAILIMMAEILQGCLVDGELLCRSEDARFAAVFKNSNVYEFEKRMNMIMNSIQMQIDEKLHIHIYILTGACDMKEDPIGIVGAIDRAIAAQKTVRDRVFYNENLVVVYDSVMREKLKERRYIETHMVEGIQNDEFRVYYQPKVSIEMGKVVGAEALVRWVRPSGEVISPGKFIPIFEENGFVTEMDFAIYRRAVADVARWLRMGLDVPIISLNVSRRHLIDEDFAEKFNALVDSLDVPHKYIEIEITESLITENLNKLVDLATDFRNNGYSISIDDFGSGYSSLNLITMVPFDTLKIDGGFFLRNDLTDKSKKVITSVVSLAKSLNLTTVSEGVETQRQVDFLKGLGCDMIQGFFYYKPMSGSDFENIIAAQTNGQRIG